VKDGDPWASVATATIGNRGNLDATKQSVVGRGRRTPPFSSANRDCGARESRTLLFSRHDTIERKLPLGKKVQLMATCLCDAFYDDAAVATVEVLEHLGLTVEFPEAQTCCGQPAFNAGDWAASRRVARHMVRTFEGELPVIVPSSSCAAMVFHGSLLAFEHEADLPEVEQLARRTWELADFIVTDSE